MINVDGAGHQIWRRTARSKGACHAKSSCWREAASARTIRACLPFVLESLGAEIQEQSSLKADGREVVYELELVVGPE